MAQQLVLNVSLREGAVFDAFHPQGNELALGSLAALADGAGEAQLYVWGAAQSGKTHLMQAVCHRAGSTGQRCAYISLAEVFEQGPEVLEGMEAMSVLCVDDLDPVLIDEAWNLALFNLINASRALGHRLVFASRGNPAHLPVLLPDLGSRLLWGAVFHLQPLQDEAKLETLRQRAHVRGFELPAEAGRYLLKVCPRDLGRLLAVLDQLDAAALASHRRITVPFIKSVLGF